jgi:hypothetical protein
LDPNQPVMVPGDPEKIAYKDRIVQGIPMDPEKFDEYVKISDSIKSCLVK